MGHRLPPRVVDLIWEFVREARSREHVHDGVGLDRTVDMRHGPAGRIDDAHLGREPTRVYA
jgi:hypothetical protein